MCKDVPYAIQTMQIKMRPHYIPVTMVNSRTLTTPAAEREAEHSFHLLLQEMEGDPTQNTSENKTKGAKSHESMRGTSNLSEGSHRLKGLHTLFFCHGILEHTILQKQCNDQWLPGV